MVSLFLAFMCAKTTLWAGVRLLHYVVWLGCVFRLDIRNRTSNLRRQCSVHSNIQSSSCKEPSQVRLWSWLWPFSVRKFACEVVLQSSTVTCSVHVLLCKKGECKQGRACAVQVLGSPLFKPIFAGKNELGTFFPSCFERLFDRTWNKFACEVVSQCSTVTCSVHVTLCKTRLPAWGDSVYSCNSQPSSFKEFLRLCLCEIALWQSYVIRLFLLTPTSRYTIPREYQMRTPD